MSRPPDMVVNVLSGILGFFGLNGPTPPGDPLGAAVWAWVRNLAYQNGLLPFKGAVTGVRDPGTGVVTGDLGFTVPAGLPLTYTVTRAPDHGSVTVDSTGAYTYTPSVGPWVTDAFTVVASDGIGASQNIASVPVVTTIQMPISYNLHGIAVSPDGSRLYVANSADTGEGHSTVLVIDTATNATIHTIAAGVTPQSVVLSPDGSRLYVTDWAEASNAIFPTTNGAVSVIDTAANAMIGRVEVGHGPSAIAVSPDGTTLYVANETDATVSVIDIATNAVTHTVAVGRMPLGVAASPDGKHVYVVGYGVKTVTVIDTATAVVSSTIPVPYSAGGVVVSPDGNRLYVIHSLSWDSIVSVIDPAAGTVIGTVGVPVYPRAVAVSPDGRRLYVANCDNNATTGCTKSVWVVDTAARVVTNVIPVGDIINDSPVAVAVSPDGKYVYTVNSAYYGYEPLYNNQSVSVVTI
ncbi:MAG: beta-propeller fold lactonase family protein [Mycobacterium sp.]